jgi:hypothetical protein
MIDGLVAIDRMYSVPPICSHMAIVLIEVAHTPPPLSCLTIHIDKETLLPIVAAPIYSVCTLGVEDVEDIVYE